MAPIPDLPISLSTAHAYAAFFTFSYVGSLYVSKSARLSFKHGVELHAREGEERKKGDDERWRNDPDVIRARLLACSISTVISVCAVYALVVGAGKGASPLRLTLLYLGATFQHSRQAWTSILLSCLVTPILFLGPLYADYLLATLPFQRRWSIQRSVKPLFMTWQGVRNYVVGPITEEIVFRACSLAAYHLARAPRTKMIFLTPLWFGVAHLHHAWDTYNRFGRTASAARQAIFQTLFQLVYTSLFGFHCAFLFLRSGSLLPPLTAHVFCNIMGLPRYGEHMQFFPTRRRSIQVAYILGIVGYIYTMRAWTRAEDSIF